MASGLFLNEVVKKDIVAFNNNKKGLGRQDGVLRDWSKEEQELRSHSVAEKTLGAAARRGGQVRLYTPPGRCTCDDWHWMKHAKPRPEFLERGKKELFKSKR